MFYVSIYANDVNAPWPACTMYHAHVRAEPSDQPLTSICTCTCIMDAQQRREAKLSHRRERERRNRALESVEEREGGE